MTRHEWRRARRGRGPAPPWWPANEPWPPSETGRWGPHRGPFSRRIGWLFAVVLFLTIVGATTVVSWLLPGASGPGPSFHMPRVGLPLLWLLFVLAFFRAGMRRFGFPLGNIVSAADRVAAGDYSARAEEYGPRSIRVVARAFNTMTSKLQVQDQQRRHLMADIAHELRTPLAVVQGRLEGMMDGIYPRDEANVTAVLEQTRMLGRLVEDLRTLAHAESGMLRLQKEPTDVAVLIGDAVRTFSSDRNGAHASLRVETAPDLPLVDIDPVRIREVLTNLISNALRHTPASGVVSVSASKAGSTIVVKVADTGHGIPEEEVPKIFDRFHKGRDSRGSGLGLTIARNLVVAHRGEIHAESRVGEGTTVTFSLPLT